ncbi:hypothetical protein NKH52_32365 [Mesorhizobium sp. M1066]|uniref:Aspartate/glutamate/uridylate kinase domain-containing protein n=1 Tax=Mesorhizobium opportunistum TaxID=593909 RepID=A0ABV1YJK0_9HYPH
MQLSTLQQLLKVGAVPIINENDTTATAELCFGDNDRLAARVAQMVNVVVLLSNVDGSSRKTHTITPQPAW